MNDAASTGLQYVGSIFGGPYTAAQCGKEGRLRL